MRRREFVTSVAGLGMMALQVATPPSVAYYNPDWSPDGAELVFESTRDGKSALYTIRLDGSNLVKLTEGLANDSQPSWSADGARIAFISDRDGHSQIYVMDRDGRRQRRVTQSAEVDFSPSISPKGDRVAFMSRAAGGEGGYDIHVATIEGNERRRFSAPGTDETDPVWSHDATRLLFIRGQVINYRGPAEEVRRARATQEIVVVAADGSRETALTNNNARECCLSWSADGGTIYFISDRAGTNDVYAMTSDGATVRKVADGRIVTRPNVSPDDRHFVYARAAGGVSGIYVYDRQSATERSVISSK